MDQSIIDLNAAADAIISKLNAIKAALDAAAVPPAITAADVQAVTDKINAANAAVPAP